MICTSRERKQLVAVDCRSTCIVEGESLDIVDISLEIRFALGVEEVVMLEHFIALSVDPAFKNRDDLKLLLLIQRIELNDRVLFQEFLVLIPLQRREHRSLSHVMAIDDCIGTERLYGAALVDIGQAALGAVFVKIMIQIEIIRCVHDGIVDNSSLYFDPTDQIAVPRI